MWRSTKLEPLVARERGHADDWRNGMRLAAFAAAFAWTGAALAAGDIRVSGAWVRETLPGQQVSAAYMDLESSTAAALLGATSGVAQSVELHTMTVEEGVMRMRRLERLPIAGNQTIRLEPGGTHLMLLGVKAPLKAGEKVPLELLLEQDGRQTRVKIEADVRALAPVHRH